jgi:hypothetical protein
LFGIVRRAVAGPVFGTGQPDTTALERVFTATVGSVRKG